MLSCSYNDSRDNEYLRFNLGLLRQNHKEVHNILKDKYVMIAPRNLKSDYREEVAKIYYDYFQTRVTSLQGVSGVEQKRLRLY